MGQFGELHVTTHSAGVYRRRLLDSPQDLRRIRVPFAAEPRLSIFVRPYWRSRRTTAACDTFQSLERLLMRVVVPSSSAEVIRCVTIAMSQRIPSHLGQRIVERRSGMLVKISISGLTEANYNPKAIELAGMRNVYLRLSHAHCRRTWHCIFSCSAPPFARNTPYP